MSDSNKPYATIESETVVLGAAWPRRRVLAAIATLGAGSLVFRRALAALAEESPRVSSKMIRQAEWISGIEFTKDERDLMLEDLAESLNQYAEIRAVPLDNSVVPALRFEPLPATRVEADETASRDRIVILTVLKRAATAAVTLHLLVVDVEVERMICGALYGPLLYAGGINVE